jgi:acetyl-CoA carboxylase biotin carboxyl carrier protein
MDTQQIKELIELMVEHDLNRIEIEEGETHILLKRGQPVVHTAPAPVVAAAVPAAAPAAPAPAAAPAPVAPATEELVVRSPMVGTFYASADPDSPPFVSVGDLVGPDTVVCLVEAMKVFNEIKAEVSGRVTKALVKNGQAVEFDQPLFTVTPA